MAALVVDTHALLWSLFEPNKLSDDALAALTTATAGGDRVYLSAISVVEVCYLVEKGKLASDIFDRLLHILQAADSGLFVAPIDLAIARTVRQIPRALVPEMPDRVIGATALYLDLPLVTRDLELRSAPITTIW